MSSSKSSGSLTNPPCLKRINACVVLSTKSSLSPYGNCLLYTSDAADEEFADEVIEECASFPFGDHDDLVDGTTQALMRFRQGGFVSLPDDYKEDPLPRIDKEYY